MRKTKKQIRGKKFAIDEYQLIIQANKKSNTKHFGTSNFIKPDNSKESYKREYKTRKGSTELRFGKRSLNAYLNDVYAKNKSMIRDKLYDPDYMNSDSKMRSAFKSTIEIIMEEENVDVDQAITMLGRSRQFMTQNEISMENVINSITSKELKSMSRFTEIRNINFKKDFNWDRENQMWIHSSGSFGLVYSYPDDSKTESIVSLIQL